MKTQARVVVIGGGAIAVSVAYHLAKYGWSDVVLIEKHELTSGSTWMAAGNCSFFHGNYYCTQVNMKSIELYQSLEEETGQSVGWHTTGSIRTADNPGRMEELGYIYSMNRCLGLDVSWITPEKMKEMHPLLNTEGIIGGLYWPDDGDVDPNGITQAMAIGARIDQDNEQLLIAKGYDHNWVLNKDTDGPCLAARAFERDSGRTLEVYTTQPGIQFYCGNFMKNRIAGKAGQVYHHRGGFCLETQHFSNSPNQPNFPSTILDPGAIYEHTTIYRFSAAGGPLV